MGSGLSAAATVWGAASIAFSALLYLFDFATNISTLHTYYRYGFQCPHASSSHLLRDPICRAIRSGLLDLPAIFFWSSVTFLLLAHLTYGFIFWFTLDPRQHPLRLAYFLPFIHLYRLCRLLSHTFNRKDLKELVENQKENSSLFNVIGASVETASQFCIQFAVAVRIGEHFKSSSDSKVQVLKIPTNLMISLLVSMISGGYTTSIAVFSLIKMPMFFSKSVYLCLLIGLQTSASMLAKALCIAALAQFDKKASLKELVENQKENSSLFNVIGASMETAVQFCIQFVVAVRIGEHFNSSSNSKVPVLKMPTNLMISLLVSMISGGYTTSIAVFSLVKMPMFFSKSVCFCLLIGLQTSASMLAKALCIEALAQFDKGPRK